MRPEVWAVAERDEFGLVEASLEMLGEASSLGGQLGHSVAVILMGENVDERLCQELFHNGAGRVYLAEHELLSTYTTDVYASVLCGLIREYSPRVVMFAGTRNGLDLAPRAAARLGFPLVTGCVMARAKGGKVEMIQPVYEDQVYRTMVGRSKMPLMIVMRPGAIGRDKPDRSRKGEVVRLNPSVDPGILRQRLVRSFRADPGATDIEEADMLVIGGRGIGSKDRWALVEELASALGAGVAGSRMALDAGWVSRDRLVGQTGKTVSPRLCFELGVSGALQHSLGLRNAGFVVAVNKDRDAPIFKTANLSVVADVQQFLPALLSRLKENKSK